MLILGIETSCDETAVAIVENGKKILSNLISSQINLHKKFGGVVPEVASRKHLEVINILISEALDESKISFKELSGIAVTCGPGLEGALLIGISTAKVLSYIFNLPLIAVNHLEGHIYANFLENERIEFPFVCLIVSGGHTDLIYMKEHCKYEILGRTRDDAAGEAFDKIARFLNLGYPGGPIIDKLSKNGNPFSINFPRAYLGKNSFDFSFSGLKTAVINFSINYSEKIEDLTASFQEAIVDVLVKKTIDAAKYKKVKTILLGGGVAVNTRLRNKFIDVAFKENLKINFSSPILCTDNAAMIATLGYYKIKKRNLSNLYLDASPNLKIGEKI